MTIVKMAKIQDGNDPTKITKSRQAEAGFASIATKITKLWPAEAGFASQATKITKLRDMDIPES